VSEHLQLSIADLQAQITADEQRLADDKRLVNRLCEKAGVPALYQIAESETAITAGIRADEFYGRPLATVIREVLQKRRAVNAGPAAVQDIYDALKSGGYAFNTKNDENAKRGLYISLSKNTGTFHKLPNGLYGLLEWYPDAPRQRETKNGDKLAQKESEESESEEDRLGLDQPFEEVTHAKPR
jgi:hypothetical protein